MKVVPISQFRSLDFESLRQFLCEAATVASEKGTSQLVSISLPVRHVDPLAVLESIYERDQFHFYMEHPAGKEAIAGAEAVIAFSASGEKRFEAIQAFARGVLDNCIVTGGTDGSGNDLLPFSGPHFFTAFSFEDRLRSDAAARVFVPRWQVSISGNISVAVANVLVDAGADVDFLAKKVWAAHGKFFHFDYSGLDQEAETEADTVEISETGGSTAYPERVAKAVASIRSGKYRKIVLARCLELTRKHPFQPFVSLNGLRQYYPDCYTFSFGLENGRSFIGATPERLVEVKKGYLRTVALAGSIGRGKSASQDAQLASELINSAKDIAEHSLVAESIRERLASIHVPVKLGKESTVLRLANVQHLLLPIESEVGDGFHLLEAAQALHPTPAVGGYPVDLVRGDIAELEGFERGLYAGGIGWFNAEGEGELVVGLRSALIEGNRAKVFAGAGIVADSDPEKELKETDLKLSAMLRALG